ncbi:hypothetical protein GCM10009006_36220 [Haloarcula argentinensis]|uniref:Deoxyhypusine synthase n=1 Tax=Haloarcula argentinensis TaxID=43776 RepID=A0A830FRR2_HALAR|nr:hypothetical protein GCM10009006_36220 [Haloarcula argentinensis]
MQDADATIYLTCTSNMISSGQREVVAYLVREGYVDVLITTAGMLAEDVIKTAKPFKTGELDADEAALREQGINRLENLFVPSDRYVWLGAIPLGLLHDFDSLIEDGMLADTIGLIAIGGGVPRHPPFMTNLFRGGADYIISISTGMEGDGSLSGAPRTRQYRGGKPKTMNG